jgi:hypothetical protein
MSRTSIDTQIMKLRERLAELEKKKTSKPITHAEVVELRKKAAEAEARFLAAGRQYHQYIADHPHEKPQVDGVIDAGCHCSDHLIAAALAYGEAKNALERAVASRPAPKKRGPRKPKEVAVTV